MNLIPLSREERYNLALVFGIDKKDYKLRCWKAMINKNKIFGFIK